MTGIRERKWSRKKSCERVKTVREFTYLGDRVNAGGRYEGVVTARTRCRWFKLMECGELLHGRRYYLKLKGTAYKSYVSPAILYGGETWCLKESEMGIIKRT